MAKNYKEYKYFASRPDVVKIFDDLDAYLDFCRFELRPYNPADLYRKDSEHYRAFLNSQRPRRPYLGKNPRWNNRHQ
jgi:hypothetical protein